VGGEIDQHGHLSDLLLWFQKSIVKRRSSPYAGCVGENSSLLQAGLISLSGSAVVEAPKLRAVDLQPQLGLLLERLVRGEDQCLLGVLMLGGTRHQSAIIPEDHVVILQKFVQGGHGRKTGDGALFVQPELGAFQHQVLVT